MILWGSLGQVNSEPSSEVTSGGFPEEEECLIFNINLILILILIYI